MYTATVTCRCHIQLGCSTPCGKLSEYHLELVQQAVMLTPAAAQNGGGGGGGGDPRDFPCTGASGVTIGTIVRF